MGYLIHYLVWAETRRFALQCCQGDQLNLEHVDYYTKHVLTRDFVQQILTLYHLTVFWKMRVSMIYDDKREEIVTMLVYVVGERQSNDEEWEPNKVHY